jgi:DNA-directed RNA polymerase specialized sigma24 family protein
MRASRLTLRLSSEWCFGLVGNEADAEEIVEEDFLRGYQSASGHSPILGP